ncbi:hypothetical protein ASPSYDRAFT_511548 [Aspergillus sydowii CBS 593.65]|uniref:Uncharacterized protein n=1 Tax=Aspergillus sydowii CBS 593.65 TaxID=1036612 RepID=A0A1L9T3E8_9EURO|nr:uncharacterized protein ASPSYDRAFT_511548 [Aspergillus sydowii CBS 593.65]OJJ53939.1 hypothetical protein ASPSYDRAFT_511548 [Aspergillus sydowii CBS 593.65]
MATARVSLCRFLHLPFLYVVRVDLLLACACPRHIPSILASIHRFNRRGTLHGLRCVPLSSAIGIAVSLLYNRLAFDGPAVSHQGTAVYRSCRVVTSDIGRRIIIVEDLFILSVTQT